MANINININVTTQDSGITGVAGQQTKQAERQAKKTQERQPIDRTNEILIDNGASFNALLDILRHKPEAVAAEKVEMEEKVREAREERLRGLYGEDYDDIFGSDSDGLCGVALTKEKRRPGAAQLRKFEPRVAMMQVGSDGSCEVYANGYAVYDNGDRKTVLWVPDCGSTTYYFTPLRDNEKTYMKQKEEVGEDVFGPAPWYFAITVAGENSIEYNLVHPKSKGTASDADDPTEWEGLPDWRCVGGTKFPNPEEYVLKKEAAMERRMALSEKQHEAFVLYYEEGWKEKDIASKLGISRAAVTYRINGAIEKLKKIGAGA